MSSNAELLRVLEDVKTFQGVAGDVLPLLVDEKVHYATMRLLYGRPLWDYDVHGWLCKIPVLYGVWHPYKHALTLVHRHFFPIFALLEMTGAPSLGSNVKVQRKVLYMEKICATLLLLTPEIMPGLVTALEGARDPVACDSTLLPHLP